MTGPAKSPAAPLLVAGQVPRLYLDANILLPEYLRAIFLDIADAGLVRVHWGKQVLAEVRRNLVGSKFGKVPVFNPAKTVADCFKYRNKIGLDVALEALKDAWRRGLVRMDDLTRYARINRVKRVMQPYLEMLVA